MCCISEAVSVFSERKGNCYCTLAKFQELLSLSGSTFSHRVASKIKRTHRTSSKHRLQSVNNLESQSLCPSKQSCKSSSSSSSPPSFLDCQLLAPSKSTGPSWLARPSRFFASRTTAGTYHRLIPKTIRYQRSASVRRVVSHLSSCSRVHGRSKNANGVVCSSCRFPCDRVISAVRKQRGWMGVRGIAP